MTAGRLFTALFLLAGLASSLPASANPDDPVHDSPFPADRPADRGSSAVSDAPPGLAALLARPPAAAHGLALSAETRRRAIEEAARRLGMEGGLAREGHVIARRLEESAGALDEIYRFDRLMTHRHGFRVVPPVVARTTNAFRLRSVQEGGPEGSAAASAGQVLRITAPARIVARTPSWRDYLIRDWPVPPALPASLVANGAEEQAVFQAEAQSGWAEGVALARAIHGEDLDRLTADWLGMIEWRRLRLAAMAMPPEIQAAFEAVSGGGGEMRIDEAFLSIPVPGRLNPVMAVWRPLWRGEGRAR